MRKIKSKAIHEEVAVQIREMIRDGKFVKGQRIDEKYICENMGISRAPLEESLRMLNAEGLVQLMPHKGASVSAPHMNVRKGGSGLKSQCQKPSERREIETEGAAGPKHRYCS